MSADDIAAAIVLVLAEQAADAVHASADPMRHPLREPSRRFWVWWYGLAWRPEEEA